MENRQTLPKESILQRDLTLKEILIVVGIFLSIALYVGVLILPKYNEYKDCVNELNEIENSLGNYATEIESLPHLESKLKNLNNLIYEKKESLSYDMEDGMFLVGLSNLINELDLDMLSYEIGDSTSYNNFYAVPVDMELRGNYNRIKRVMEYLENQKNITQILDYNMDTYIHEEVIRRQVSKDNESMEDSEEIDETEEITNEEENEFVEEIVVTSRGEVSARFKFIIYSVENPTNKLDIENYNNWQPGKYNPFKTTIK